MDRSGMMHSGIKRRTTLKRMKLRRINLDTSSRGNGATLNNRGVGDTAEVENRKRKRFE